MTKADQVRLLLIEHPEYRTSQISRQVGTGLAYVRRLRAHMHAKEDKIRLEHHIAALRAQLADLRRAVVRLEQITGLATVERARNAAGLRSLPPAS